MDILTSILGAGDFERVRASSIRVELFGHPCRVMSLEDLIRAKETLGREKDLLSARELRALQQKTSKRSD